MTTDTKPEPVLLTIQAVAAGLSVSQRTVWKLIAEGRLVSVKVGRSTRVRREDLEAFVASLPTVVA